MPVPPWNITIRRTPVGNCVRRDTNGLAHNLVATKGIEKVSAHASLSQIVGEKASPFCNNLCVARKIGPSQNGGMESNDKNGGPNNLRAWRVHRGMTQEELAKAVEPPTSTNMIQYLESGERALSLKWLRRLADALNTTPGHLADFSPGEDREQAELLDLWAHKLDLEKRKQLASIARALTGTDDK